MSIKKTKVFYPHIVKQYESVEQMISENGYQEYYDALIAELTDIGNLDVTDSSVYTQVLSEDGFEAITTVVFPTEEVYNTYFEQVVAISHVDKKQPIYVEESDEHVI